MNPSLIFLADENINTVVIDFLKSQSFDTIDVFSLQLNSKPDKDILITAKQLDRVVLTHDSDFGQIIFTEKIDFKGVIYLQPGHIQPQLTIQTLQVIINSTVELIEPFIIVAEHKQGNIKIRVRNSIAP